MSGKNFFLFGVGDAIFIPTRDADGVSIAVPTPIQLESCTDIGIEKKGDAKKHEGKFQYSLASAMAKRSIEVSLTCNIHNAKSLSVSTNEAVSQSFVSMFVPTTATALAATVTIAPPASGVFKNDMGVRFEVGGDQLVRVASAPAAGQYSLVEATGVYTFAAADVAANLKAYIKYTYTTATGGSSVAEYNRLQGAMPEYSLVMTSGKYRGVQMLFEAPIVSVKDVSQPFKNGDYMAQKITVDVLANMDTGHVFTTNIPI
jgi:hypothetical protein